MVIRNWTAKQSDGWVQRRLFVQVTIPIVAVGVLLLTIGIYGAWRVHRLHKRGAAIVTENVTGIRNAEQLRATFQEFRYRLKRFSTTGDDRHLEEIAKQLPGLEQVGKNMGAENQSTEQPPRIDRALAKGVEEFTTSFTRLRDQSSSRSCREEASQLANASVLDRIFTMLEDYITVNDQQVNRSSQRNQATANRLMFGLLLLGTCGGLAGLFLGYSIARRMGRTIVGVAVSLDDMAVKLNEVIGPVAVSTNPKMHDLETVLRMISQSVASVVERLQVSEREALRAEQLAAMGQLAAGLAHEIRNPLTSMKTIVQLAEKPSDFTMKDFRILDEEIVRLEQSVRTFLDYARPAQAEKHEVSLREILEQPVALVSRRAIRQGIHLAYEPPDSAIHVVADKIQIRQVLLNILLNAFEATPEGGTVRVETSLELSEEENICEANTEQSIMAIRQSHHVLVRVIDNGKGIPENLGGRIFDPFVSTKEAGIGLGLSICRRIVEDHGGQINATNRPEGGAVFEMRLSLAPCENRKMTLISQHNSRISTGAPRAVPSTG